LLPRPPKRVSSWRAFCGLRAYVPRSCVCTSAVLLGEPRRSKHGALGLFSYAAAYAAASHAGANMVLRGFFLQECEHGLAALVLCRITVILGRPWCQGTALVPGKPALVPRHETRWFWSLGFRL
jgi:hypothetical protein